MLLCFLPLLKKSNSTPAFNRKMRATQEAYSKLYSVRACNPKLFAIREATCDLLYGADLQPASITVARQHPDSVIEVSMRAKLAPQAD